MLYQQDVGLVKYRSSHERECWFEGFGLNVLPDGRTFYFADFGLHFRKSMHKFADLLQLLCIRNGTPISGIIEVHERLASFRLA